jgi:hypothetical protein
MILRFSRFAIYLVEDAEISIFLFKERNSVSNSAIYSSIHPVKPVCSSAFSGLFFTHESILLKIFRKSFS